MPHANAPLSPLGRLRMARFHVQTGSSIRATAEMFQVSTTTVIRWRDRFAALQAAGIEPTAAMMADRSSRPLRSPRRTPAAVEARVLALRSRRRMGPVQLAGRLGMPASTVHRVLQRAGVSRLDRLERSTGIAVRFERQTPGELVHVDVKKLGLIPAGGGWRVRGRQASEPGRSGRERRRKHETARRGSGKAGYAFVHSAVDDRTRLAYSEVHDDETAATTTAFWQRAIAFFAAHGAPVREVITDNGPAYRSREWARINAEHRIQTLRTRPYRPQTNGKVERYQRTMRDEWAYAKAYRSESARRAALDSWLHIYNHHRPHTAIGGQPPITLVTNVPGQNS